MIASKCSVFCVRAILRQDGLITLRRQLTSEDKTKENRVCAAPCLRLCNNVFRAVMMHAQPRGSLRTNLGISIVLILVCSRVYLGLSHAAPEESKSSHRVCRDLLACRFAKRTFRPHMDELQASSSLPYVASQGDYQSTIMSADKRALDDLDALFRAVPAEAVSSSRPSKKLRDGRTTAVGAAGAAAVVSAIEASEGESSTNESRHITDDSQRVYTRLPPALLPLGSRPAPAAPRGKNRASVGTAAALRLTEFVRGVLGARGERAATLAIESKLRRKVVNLENSSSAQTEAQSAGMRAMRSSSPGRAKRGLSGKQSKKMGLNILEAQGGGQLMFRDLLGLHDVWKGYAGRLVSQCGSNERLVQQRILAADLQGCYLTVSRASDPSLVNVTGIVLRETANMFQLITPNSKTKTIPKRACAVRLAFGGLVVNLDARALAGRLGGQKKDRGRQPSPAGGSGDTATAVGFPLPTAAL